MTPFQSNILNLYGEKGKLWLHELPECIAALSLRLNLRNLKEIEGSYHYVLSGFQGDNPIVLKLGFDPQVLEQEAFALNCFLGYGAIKVLEADTVMLLLERAIPGISLKSYFPDKEAASIKIVCQVMKKLHRTHMPKTHTFPHIKDWIVELERGLKIPLKTLQKARALGYQLLKTAGPDVLLHGDLHHDNILQNEQGWVVIDPKGVIGEAAYEVAAFILNPIPELLTQKDLKKIIRNRIIQFAEGLQLPSERIFDWCWVQAVLAWSWAIEDGSDTSYFEQFTQVLDHLR